MHRVDDESWLGSVFLRLGKVSKEKLADILRGRRTVTDDELCQVLEDEGVIKRSDVERAVAIKGQLKEGHQASAALMVAEDALERAMYEARRMRDIIKTHAENGSGPVVAK